MNIDTEIDINLKSNKKKKTFKEWFHSIFHKPRCLINDAEDIESAVYIKPDDSYATLVELP